MGKVILSETQFLNLKKNLNKRIIKEAEWYNYVLDVLGTLDPTPTLDLLNALSHWKQGESFNAVMSFLSAIPYGGDFVGKPVKLAVAGGHKSAKKLKEAMDMIEHNPSQANKLFRELAENDDAIGDMIRSSKDWGPKLENKLDLLPPEMSGISDYLSKVLAFFQNNSLKMKWAYGLLPKGDSEFEDDGAVADFPIFPGEARYDDPPESDPMRNMFSNLFTGKLI